MGNIRREKKKQATFFRTLMILAVGIALITTVIIVMLFKDKKDVHSMRMNTNSYSYIK